MIYHLDLCLLFNISPLINVASDTIQSLNSLIGNG